MSRQVETKRNSGSRTRKWLWYGVLAIGLSSALVASAHEDTFPPPEALDDKLWSDLEALGAPRKLLLVVKIWDDGTVDIKKGGPGVDEPWEDIPSELYHGSLFWEIGNPKICYQTSGGDMKCIRYN